MPNGHEADARDPASPELEQTAPRDADSSNRGTGHPSEFTAASRRGRGRRRWVLLVSVLGAVGLVSLLLGFGLTRDPTAIRSPLLGRPAPDFALRTLDGTSVVHLRSLRGQVVVVNFWASWCAACREEHPDLLAAWERYRGQGVVLVGIDFQDRREPAIDFMRQMGGDWPVVEDPGSRTALDYGVYGIPETFFIGRDGVIVFKVIGPSTYEVLTEQIQRLLEGDEGRI